MKKILVIITTGFCSYGGLTTVAMNYYRNMDKSELQIDFCSSNELEAGLKEELDSSNSDYYVLPDRKRQIISYCMKLKRIIENNKYEIIHVHGNSATMFFELEVGKLCKVPKRIAHGHNTKSNYPLVHKLLSYLFNKSYTDAIAVSKKVGNWLYSGNKYTILNNAIDIEKYEYNAQIRNEYREKLNITDEFVIGNVGKLNTQKNHKFLIEIFNEFHKINPVSKLLIVGGGYLKEDLEKLIKNYGLENDVILVGMKTNVEDYLNAMDVFAFTSIFEGLGMVLIEAQASGLYCFCSDTVPKETSVTDNIQYVSLKDTAIKWAQKIVGNTYPQRTDYICVENSIRRNGYDIKLEAYKLRQIYLK